MGFSATNTAIIPKEAAPVYKAPRSYSDEQLAIINSSADVVVGQAFAGTGKSTTGIGYAVHNPDKRILVICFNRANTLESKAKYGTLNHPSVDVLTIHALARRNLSYRQNLRVADRWSAITLRNELPFVGGRGDMRTAAIVASLLNEFFFTTDVDIDPVLHGNDARDRLHANDTSISQCVNLAKRLWFAMNSDEPVQGMRTATNTIAIPHDAYLKMFVMSAGNLGYDTVIFDEAQDANPIMLHLLKTQYSTGSKVIMLGDRHQSIYAFRGALNALENHLLPSGAHVLPLTQSWRFGPRTAEIANCILRELKGETHSIKGMGADSIYKKGQPLTYLSRTNADLLMRAASVNGEGVNWVGGIQNYRVGILNDVWALCCGRLNDIKDVFIKKHFQSWAEFENAAEIDAETKILANIIGKYGNTIPLLVRDLEANAQKTLLTGEISMTLTTGHKAKGLEWDYVKISEDFSGVIKAAENWLNDKTPLFPEQEINLLYVMATRAKCQLLGNHEMQEWLMPENQQRFQQMRVRKFDNNDKAGKEIRQRLSESKTAPNAFANIQRPIFRAA